MANMLDELNPEIREEGLNANVIAKKVPVTVGKGSLVFEICLWLCFILPGLIFTIMKIKAGDYFQQLEQRIQTMASEIDNRLEERVMVLQNCARLLDKSIELDKSTYENIAKYRSGYAGSDESRNELAGQLDSVSRSINLAFENYPELSAHKEIQDAMRQNMYLQREITAARSNYNDVINTWNREIFEWPTKRIVAAKKGYTTRIPFIASAEIKKQATGVFF